MRKAAGCKPEPSQRATSVETRTGRAKAKGPAGSRVRGAFYKGVTLNEPLPYTVLGVGRGLMAVCPICREAEIPLRAPGLGGGPLITCKSAECRRLYLLAQSRRNWRTHRDLQRKKAGLDHRCYTCGKMTTLLKQTCGRRSCIDWYRRCGQWRRMAAEKKARSGSRGARGARRPVWGGPSKAR